MNAAFVINCESGTQSRTAASSDALAELCRQVRCAGFTGTIIATGGAQVADSIQRLAETGVDRVIVGGGDGTVSAAATVIARLGLTLGVLPMGTCNHFAHDIGVPDKLGEALEWLADASVRSIDLGEVNGRIFINNVSAGLYPRVIRERANDRILGSKRLATWIAAAKALRPFRLMYVRLQTTESTVSRFSPFVFVGNNPYSGDLLSKAKRPSLNDRRLWVCTAAVTGVLPLARIAWNSLWGDVETVAGINTATVREISISFRKSQVLVAIDGEFCRLQSPLKFRSLGGELKVLVKAGT